jgi:hypothetical protein
MFQLTQKEFDALRSQNATSNAKARGAVATFHGSLPSMGRLWRLTFSTALEQCKPASLLLERFCVCAPWRYRSKSSRKVTALERKYDEQFRIVFDAIRQLLEPPNESPKRRIGFHQ